jgi:SAM-dependent methyltransferase
MKKFSRDKDVWPKTMPPLTPEQQAIREDFMQHWHEVLPNRYSRLERFNHGFPTAQRSDWPDRRVRTLEVGSGLGEHIAHEDLSFQDYTALELRESMATQIRQRYPQVEVIVADVQAGIPALDRMFDRVVAVHVLEHLSNLPRALDEFRRVLKATGHLEIVMPCEGGLVYEIGRTLTSRRLFERRYHSSYDWFIRSEHVNNCWEIDREISARFVIKRRHYWPLRVPSYQANAVVGIVAAPVHIR